jgi:(2Fe-2S) ferredoxin
MYRCHVFVCLNQRADDTPCCAGKDSEQLFTYMKQRVAACGLTDVRINRAGCLGQCAQGPVLVVYPENIWYAPRSKDDIEVIVHKHLQGKVPVDSLQLARR